MNASQPVDVIVVGGGPAGYTAAHGCASRGLQTVLVERAELGGTCLNVGCIPSKALIHAAGRYHSLGAAGELGAMGIIACEGRLDWPATLAWTGGIVTRLQAGVDQAVRGAGVDIVRGSAEILDARTVLVRSGSDQRTIGARSLVLATGSRPVGLAHLDGDPRVLGSTELLGIERIPARLVVVGGGYIGLELGTAFCKMGSAVTVVELGERPLPQFDEELSRPVRSRLAQLGVQVLENSSATAMTDDGLVVTAAGGERREVPADNVVVTVGRRPNLEEFGLERLGVTMHAGAIAVDSRCRTSIDGVYAVGDVTGEPMLAHRGIAQGELVARVISGAAEDEQWDHLAIPAVCFTDPEVFAVGLSPQDPPLAGSDPVVGRARFKVNARALTLNEEDGFVRVVADRGTGVVLGMQGVGPDVSEVSAVAAVAVEMAATLDDLAATIVAHPTLGEIVHEAVLDARRRLRR